MEIPTIETAAFLTAKDQNQTQGNEDITVLCKKAAQILIDTGILIVRDPRVNSQDNDSFLDTVEDYFNQEYDIKMKDARPQHGYQVGVTPENTEVPRCKNDDSCIEIIDKLAADSKPHEIIGADPKWRFFWKMGTLPPTTQFPDLNAQPVVPETFPEWSTVMNRWGTLMRDVCSTVAEMTAIGLGLEADAFTRIAKFGPHLLAPTASDLKKYNALGTVFAGFHYDLNFLTIHGKSRYPGLYVWNKDGQKISVRVPEGCLLIQAGKQIEWLTGATIKAGYHEVVVNEGTLQAVEKAKANNRPLWRISSTLFWHISSDETLQPLGHFANDVTLAQYPPTLAGNYVQNELRYINLRK